MNMGGNGPRPGNGHNPVNGPPAGGNAGGPLDPDNGSVGLGFQQNPKELNRGQYHITVSSTCRRDQKLKKRAVNAVLPAVPRYLKRSEYPITWSREDHPDRVDAPGALALVVAPQISGYILQKVLMDGGSSINILYWDTFIRMGFTVKPLHPSGTIFHGIVPGKSARPEGTITLEVAFGESKDNFRSEMICFEVVKLKSPYHALFGRNVFASFMARPCYVYLKMKMPGPNGIITVNGSRELALQCEEGDVVMAEQACAEEELN